MEIIYNNDPLKAREKHLNALSGSTLVVFNRVVGKSDLPLAIILFENTIEHYENEDTFECTIRKAYWAGKKIAPRIKLGNRPIIDKYNTAEEAMKETEYLENKAIKDIAHELYDGEPYSRYVKKYDLHTGDMYRPFPITKLQHDSTTITFGWIDAVLCYQFRIIDRLSSFNTTFSDETEFRIEFEGIGNQYAKLPENINLVRMLRTDNWYDAYKNMMSIRALLYYFYLKEMLRNAI